MIVPAFNAADFIAETLKSIALQTYGNFECLVCDDGSTDATAAVVAEFARHDRRFQLHRQAKNHGVAYTRNRGVASSRGELVAICDADDYWYPEKLEEQSALLTSSNADLVFSLVEIKDANGRTSRVYPGAITEGMFDSSEAFVRVLRFNVAVCGSNILWRKARFTGKLFSEDLCPADDWDFLLWASRNRTIACCPKHHVRYQRREGSITGAYPHLPDLYLGVLKHWAASVSPQDWCTWQRLQQWAVLLQSTLYPVYRTMSAPYDTAWDEMADLQRLQAESSRRYQDELKRELMRQESNA